MINYEKDDIVIVKLISGEEVIGRIKRKFHDGGVILDDTRIVLTSELGCYMERFIPFCENNDYYFAPGVMLTIGRPLEALIEFFNKGEDSSFPGGKIALSTDTKH